MSNNIYLLSNPVNLYELRCWQFPQNHYLSILTIIKYTLKLKIKVSIHGDIRINCKIFKSLYKFRYYLLWRSDWNILEKHQPKKNNTYLSLKDGGD